MRKFFHMLGRFVDFAEMQYGVALYAFAPWLYRLVVTNALFALMSYGKVISSRKGWVSVSTFCASRLMLDVRALRV